MLKVVSIFMGHPVYSGQTKEQTKGGAKYLAGYKRSFSFLPLFSFFFLSLEPLREYMTSTLLHDAREIESLYFLIWPTASKLLVGRGAPQSASFYSTKMCD